MWVGVKKGLDISSYLSSPGVPDQRDTNENTNGRIRCTYPKGTKFGSKPKNDINDFLLNFNQVPRKVLIK
ncbi:hypothetical protein ACFSFY_14460 [Sporosarcina siberiensis]|uniref:Uncharacterized protein n=1 Tax=Sporosarcina siberiensis TaxID=1365606 RepID=A0ABW4SI70_9BACL